METLVGYGRSQGVTLNKKKGDCIIKHLLLVKAIRLDPSNLRGHEMYGTMLQELGYYKRALAHLKQAQKLLHSKMESELKHPLQHPHANSVEFVREIDGEEITLSADQWRDYDISQNIKAIEAGTPLIGSLRKKHQ
jgi:hypothetical protein